MSEKNKLETKNYNEEYFKQLEKDISQNRYVVIDEDIDGDQYIKIYIQNGPIKEFGINGTQIDTLGEIWLNLLQQFNKKFRCRANSISITKIQEALLWQHQRKVDREKRKVEGIDHN